MKRKATPQQISAAQAHIHRWETPRTPTAEIRLKMVLNGWADPQSVTIDNTLYIYRRYDRISHCLYQR